MHKDAETARLVALTDAPQMLIVFAIWTLFSTTALNSATDLTVKKAITAERKRSHESPDVGVQSYRRRARLRSQGPELERPGSHGIRLHLACNRMSAHGEAAIPSGTYPRGHRHGPGAHIVILSGEGYSFLWEEGQPRIRIDWRPE